MKVSRAGKQEQAYWRSERWHHRKWMAEKPVTVHERLFGQDRRTVERLQGFAAGWIAGVRWARRSGKRK